ncbi:uncharacterized protein LOC110242468 isoform X2 [Exaiptasia diaphana]|nr:uncharacterized protein LOC110242468 isoform X2 [Exaiptasia diaphana]XP_020904115.1 uncharacterized protein LOC110242468 isoform X2 [Exaiptasia diaphana]KXJ26112.1 hypothetical protein AC249_AIPGENE15860 [Exaiptasia diaphana]
MKIITSLCMILLLQYVASSLKNPCMGKEVKLSCPYHRPVWKFIVKAGSSRQIHLTNWLDNRTIISSSAPNQFEGVLGITQNNQLTISSFQAKHNGIYMCVDETGRRKKYHLIAVQCQVDVCIRDNAIIECPIYRHFNHNKLVWTHGKTTILEANRHLDTTYFNKAYRGITLNKTLGALVVPPAFDDIHQYTCALYSDGGQTPKRLTIKLNQMNCIEKISVFAKENVELVCPYHSLLKTHSETIKLIWTKGSRKIATIDVHGYEVNDKSISVAVDGNITLQSVTGRDNGTFTCSVLRWGKIELARHSVTLEVKPLPIASLDSIRNKGNRTNPGIASGGSKGKQASTLISVLVLGTLIITTT